jgi:hypothetical protein
MVGIAPVRLTPRQVSASTFAVVAATCVAEGHVGLGVVVTLALATSLVVHRPRAGYTGADFSACDALDPLFCLAWVAGVAAELYVLWVRATALCLALVGACYIATRMLPYRSGPRDAAHVCMHLAASIGTIALVRCHRTGLP